MISCLLDRYIQCNRTMFRVNISDFQGTNGPLVTTQHAQLQPEFESESVLHLAAQEGQVEHLQRLLARGFHVNVTNFEGSTPLHGACLSGNVACVRLLLEAGANVNARNVDGANPLCDACTNGCLSCVRLLLKYGADVNPDLSLTTPLHEAALKDHVHLIADLVDAGAKLEANDLHFGTALHVAAYKNHVDCAIQLLHRGANVNATKTHHSPLHQAAANNCHQMVALLLEYGANVYARNYWDKPARHFTEADTKISTLLQDAESEPRALGDLCRLSIRSHLMARGLDNIDQLPLPTFLKNYIRHDR